MKTIELFCASQSSTAICLNTDHASSSSSSNTIQFGGRAIDRHNPIITDPKRTPARDFTLPASPSPSPINPKPLHHLKKTKKKKSTTTAENSTQLKHIANNFSSKPFDSILRRSWVKPPSDLITPPSSRYLLDDITSLDTVLGSTKVDDNKKKAQVSHEDENNHSSKQHSTPSAPNSSSTSQVGISLYLNSM